MAKSKKRYALPTLINRKIYKTGQTRGADDDVIYQNRVGRNSTVLIPYHQWVNDKSLRDMACTFENGYIVLISPSDYFAMEKPDAELLESNLILGLNTLVFYETRYDWEKYNPEEKNWTPPDSRTSPLGGEYVARVPATTATDDLKSKKIIVGYSTKSMKGAGIRLYEYAASSTIKDCRLQLEMIFWLCKDSLEVVQSYGMSYSDAVGRKQMITEECIDKGLLDYDRLIKMRILNNNHQTICPLCLETLSAVGFFNKVAQPEGRDVPDLTVTELNLFHINELKYGEFNHRPYNLGWGHHFCNVVVKDSGIYPTLDWMNSVLEINKKYKFI